MKSPVRRRIRPSPGELERKIQEEKIKRRKERLIRVRQQSNVAALSSLVRVKKESEIELEKIAKIEMRKFQNEKNSELLAVEKEYHECLQAMGQGFRLALEEENDDKRKAIHQKKIEQRQIAEKRESSALHEYNRQRSLENKLNKQRIEDRRRALLVEKRRSAKILKSVSPPKNKILFTEFTNNRVHKKFIDKAEMTSSNKENILVTKILPDPSFQSPTSESLEKEKEKILVCPSLEMIRKETETIVSAAKAEYLSLYQKGKSVSFDLSDYSLRENNENSSKNSSDSDVLCNSLQTVVSRFPQPSENESLSNDVVDESRQNVSWTIGLSPTKQTNTNNNISYHNYINNNNTIINNNNNKKKINSLKLMDKKRQSSSLGVSITLEQTSCSSSERDSISISQDTLRTYVGRLLEMKREEINKLSSFSGSTSGSFEDKSSSFIASTPSSLLSSTTSSSDSSIRRFKSVRFRTHENILSSTSTKKEEFKDNMIKADEKCSEGLLSSSSSSLLKSDDSLLNIKITSTSSSRIQELKDKIYNMEIPLIPKHFTSSSS